MNLKLLVSMNNNNDVILYLSLHEPRVMVGVNIISVHNNIVTYLKFNEIIKECINRLSVYPLLPRNVL